MTYTALLVFLSGALSFDDANTIVGDKEWQTHSPLYPHPCNDILQLSFTSTGEMPELTDVWGIPQPLNTELQTSPYVALFDRPVYP